MTLTPSLKTCIICHKPFASYQDEVKGGRGGRTSPKRTSHSRTCSKPCAKVFRRLTPNQLKKLETGGLEQLIADGLKINISFMIMKARRESSGHKSFVTEGKIK